MKRHRPIPSGQIWLPLAIAIIMTVVSFYYYLRVVVAMITVPEEGLVKPARPGFSTSTVLAVAAVATIGLGIFPATVLGWATHAASLHF